MIKKFIFIVIFLTTPLFAKENVQVSIVKVNRLVIVDGQFDINASSQSIWNVLTDYNHLSKFVSSMRSSREVTRRRNEVLVEQVGVAKWFFVKKSFYVLLQVIEMPMSEVYFEDISQNDFTIYIGYWNISNNHVEYHLETECKTKGPLSVEEKTVKKLLFDVREEILRRR